MVRNKISYLTCEAISFIESDLWSLDNLELNFMEFGAPRHKVSRLEI